MHVVFHDPLAAGGREDLQARIPGTLPPKKYPNRRKPPVENRRQAKQDVLRDHQELTSRQKESEMTPAKFQNWTGLSVGLHVTVEEPTGEPYPAVVDAMTPDSSVIWVVGELPRFRKAFDYREGVIVTP